MEQIHKKSLQASFKIREDDLPRFCLELGFSETGPADAVGEGMCVVWDLCPVVMLCPNHGVSVCLCLRVHGTCGAHAAIAGIAV